MGAGKNSTVGKQFTVQSREFKNWGFISMIMRYLTQQKSSILPGFPVTDPVLARIGEYPLVRPTWNHPRGMEISAGMTPEFHCIFQIQNSVFPISPFSSFLTE